MLGTLLKNLLVTAQERQIPTVQTIPSVKQTSGQVIPEPQFGMTPYLTF